MKPFNKVIKVIVAAVSAISMLIIFIISNLTFHHFKFEVNGIVDSKMKNYFNEECLDFLKCDGVMFYSSIKATNTDEYIIWLVAVTKDTETEAVIKSFCLSEKNTGKVILSNTEFEQAITFELNEKTGIFDGSIAGGYILPAEYILDKSGKTDLRMDMNVQVQRNGKFETKNISYDIDAVAYFTSKWDIFT